MVLADLLAHPPPYLTHATLTVAQVMFATVQVSTKEALKTIPPFTFAAMRILIALPALLLSARALEPGPHPSTRRDNMMHVWLGLAGVTGPQGLLLTGVKLAGPDAVAIMQPTIPVWVALVTAAFGLEALSPQKAAGIACSVGGALVMLNVTGMNIHSAQTIGMIVILLQVLSYTAFIVPLSVYLQQVDRPLTVFARASVAGAFFLVVLAFADVENVLWADVPLSTWMILVYCGLAVSFLAHSSISWAVKHVSATVPSLYTCLQPFATTVLSSIAFGDVLGPADAVGMVLILVGLFVTVDARRKHMIQETGAADARSEEISLVAAGTRLNSITTVGTPVDKD